MQEWRKFDKDWTNQYEVIKDLPKPCHDEFSDEEPGFDSLLEVYIRKSESVYGD